MIDDKFRTDLQALVTAFLEGGGGTTTAIRALDSQSDALWTVDFKADIDRSDWPFDTDSDEED